MNHENLAEMTPVKIGAGVIGLLTMLCFGLILSHLSGPTPAEQAGMTLKHLEAEARLAQAEYMRDVESQTRSEEFGDLAAVYSR